MSIVGFIENRTCVLEHESLFVSRSQALRELFG